MGLNKMMPPSRGMRTNSQLLLCHSFLLRAGEDKFSLPPLTIRLLGSASGCCFDAIAFFSALTFAGPEK